jgi:hypothetical protein
MEKRRTGKNTFLNFTISAVTDVTKPLRSSRYVPPPGTKGGQALPDAIDMDITPKAQGESYEEFIDSCLFPKDSLIDDFGLKDEQSLDVEIGVAVSDAPGDGNARPCWVLQQRTIPSLNRGWHTPDPSPTRDAVGLPKCMPAILTMKLTHFASPDGLQRSSALKHCGRRTSRYRKRVGKQRICQEIEEMGDPLEDEAKEVKREKEQQLREIEERAEAARKKKRDRREQCQR